jgi:hypothetical protein
MMREKELLQQTQANWNPILLAYEKGKQFDLMSCLTNGDLSLSSYFPKSPELFLPHKICSIPALVVGVDVREWTRRTPAVRTLITALLYYNIRRTCEIIRKGGLLVEEPTFISHTGDGAMVVFDTWEYLKGESYCGFWDGQCNQPCLEPVWNARGCPGRPKKIGPRVEPIAAAPEVPPKGLDELDQENRIYQSILKALAFIFSLNAITQQDNEGKRFNVLPEPYQSEHGEEYLPLYLRYALSFGRVTPVIGAQGQLECIGPPMVTCNRILSTDHGNHFLLERNLLVQINKFGGLLRIGEGVPGFDWKQELYVSELPDKKIKYGSFRYADVFGHHQDGPLLAARGMSHIRPNRFQIGSHDAKVLD